MSRLYNVHDIVSSLVECEGSPFDKTHPVLRSIQSGIPATPEVKLDLSKALHEGANQVETLLRERVFNKTAKVTDRIPKNKRLNFENMTIIKKSSKSLNHARMEQAGLAAAVEFKESLGALPLEEILARRLTDECLSMYYVDGSQRKPVKSKLLEHLNLKESPINPVEYSSLVDMGMIWHLAIPTPDDRESIKRDGREYRWHDYLEKMVSTITS